MRYEWDEARNLRNQRKHDGISFGPAALVFEDECCLVYPDRIQYPEDHHGEEIVRIVSARAAEKHEIRRYREQAMD